MFYLRDFIRLIFTFQKLSLVVDRGVPLISLLKRARRLAFSCLARVLRVLRDLSGIRGTARCLSCLCIFIFLFADIDIRIILSEIYRTCVYFQLERLFCAKVTSFAREEKRHSERIFASVCCLAGTLFIHAGHTVKGLWFGDLPREKRPTFTMLQSWFIVVIKG